MKTETRPAVSVLLAARNEENNILRTLQSLNKVDFPAEMIEILIGDDDSTDRTAEIVLDFIKDKPQFSYHKITASGHDLKGKTNVLAQLATIAGGDFFFFCDADIAVPTTWITSMLSHFQPSTGVVTGLTRMKKSSLLADFLSLEWLFALSVMRLGSLVNVPVTGMGNNMAVSKKAYKAVGGYESVGFSIVEDYALFMAITEKGFGFAQAFSPNVLSLSEPVHSFAQLQNQRKRWMHGVMESHWLTRLNIILSAAVIPFLMVIMLFAPKIAALIFAAHYTATTVVAMTCVILLKQKDLFKTLPLFWFYLFGYASIMLVNYFSPGKVTWKGREY